MDVFEKEQLAECEVDIRNFSTEQVIIQASTNPNLLLYVTNNIKNTSNNKRNSRQEDEASNIYLSCSKCDKTFKYKSSLVLHMKAHLNVNQWTCQTCGEVVTDARGRARHRNRHRKLNKKCTTCGKLFRTKTAFDAHSFMHIGQKPHKCVVCSRGFLYKHTLTAHMLRHCGDGNKKMKRFECEHCNRKYNYASELKRHVLHHREHKEFLCSLCGKSYALLATLKTHLKTHDPCKAYECEHCRRAFMKKSVMQSHIRRVHNDEKPAFLCHSCPKQFYGKYELNQHMNLHLTGGRTRR